MGWDLGLGTYDCLLLYVSECRLRFAINCLHSGMCWAKEIDTASNERNECFLLDELINAIKKTIRPRRYCDRN